MKKMDDNLSLYAEYNKTLRAWLVGFGFGVPALFIIDKAAQDKLVANQDAIFIISLFIIGAAAQVFMAQLNKIVSWCAYYKHEKGQSNVNCAVLFFSSLENYFLIDVLLDLLSLSAFGWSIFLIVGLFL
ncbi:MAG: hypothetical protein HY940_02855 [Gammaproteobacteria bacterium]|nr:hypothetical protein [Gammaproteobacteria bacterium]